MTESAAICCSSAVSTIGYQSLPLVRGTSTLSRGIQVEIGWHEPDVMRITLTNDYDVTFTNQLSGDANTTGTDTFDGVLVEQADGSWTGAVFATAQGTADGVFLGQDPHCSTTWRATQVLDVFGENRPGVLPGELPGVTNGNFVMEFYPLTPPRAAYGTTLCSAARRHGSRFDYVPFNDARVWNPDNGLAIELPPKPPSTGGNRITNHIYIEVTSPTNVDLHNTWQVRIEYPEPPPP